MVIIYQHIVTTITKMEFLTVFILLIIIVVRNTKHFSLSVQCTKCRSRKFVNRRKRETTDTLLAEKFARAERNCKIERMKQRLSCI